jgi:hypothetical protein
MDLLSIMSSNSKNNAHRFHSHHKCKNFVKIDTLTLNLPLGNESGFVVHDAAVFIALQLQDPL